MTIYKTFSANFEKITHDSAQINYLDRRIKEIFQIMDKCMFPFWLIGFF